MRLGYLLVMPLELLVRPLSLVERSPDQGCFSAEDDDFPRRGEKVIHALGRKLGLPEMAGLDARENLGKSYC